MFSKQKQLSVKFILLLLMFFTITLLVSYPMYLNNIYLSIILASIMLFSVLFFWIIQIKFINKETHSEVSYSLKMSVFLDLITTSISIFSCILLIVLCTLMIFNDLNYVSTLKNLFWIMMAFLVIIINTRKNIFIINQFISLVFIFLLSISVFSINSFTLIKKGNNEIIILEKGQHYFNIDMNAEVLNYNRVSFVVVKAKGFVLFYSVKLKTLSKRALKDMNDLQRVLVSSDRVLKIDSDSEENIKTSLEILYPNLVFTKK